MNSKKGQQESVETALGTAVAATSRLNPALATSSAHIAHTQRVHFHFERAADLFLLA